MIRRKVVLTCLYFICFTGLAQDVSLDNLRATADGKITFDYQIQPGHSTRELYTVQIFTSADDYKQPLGIDLKDIPAGKILNVSFLGASLLPSFSGALKIKLKAEATLYPVQITSSPDKIKMGGSIDVAWKDENNEGPYDVLLAQEGKKTSLASSVSGSSYIGDVPVEFAKGKYEILVQPSGNQRLVSDEAQLIIASKLGLGLKVLGGLVAGGVVILAIPPPTETSNLPGPPDVPDN